MKLVNTIRARAGSNKSSHENTLSSLELQSSYTAVYSKQNAHGARNTKLQSILDWILSLTVFSLLFWFAWTIIARHYYGAFSSTYFPGKSGSRIFMIMVVFYLMIGFLILIGAHHNISLPSSPLKMTRYFRIPIVNEYYTGTEVLVIFLYTVVQPIAIIMASRQKLKADMEPYKWWYSFGKILGMSAVYSLMLLFFPVSKRNFWLEFFNVKFERAIKFHKMLAGFMVFFVILHVLSSSRGMILANQFWMCLIPNDQCMFDSRVIMYGWIAALTALPLLLTSISWVRRRNYELFYYTHFLFLPFVIIMQLHYDHFIYYAAPGTVAYLLDKILWWCSARSPVSIVHLYCPIQGYIRLVLAVEPGYSCEPGQWMSLNIPQVSKWQYHPLSIASAPPSKENPTITFDLKAEGDWTEGVESLALRYDPKTHPNSKVFLDGFHGTSHLKSHGYLTHSAIMMISGGIGVTPIMSALRTISAFHKQSHPSLNYDFSHVKRIVFVWVVREEKLLDLYREELSEIQNQSSTMHDCEIILHLHVTRTKVKAHLSNITNDQSNPDARILKAIHAHMDETSSLLSSSIKTLPVMQQVMGHSHDLVLTMVAGIGFVLGMLLANSAEDGKEGWNYETFQLLQPLFAVLFTLVLVGLAMSASVLRSCEASGTSSFSHYASFSTPDPKVDTDIEAIQNTSEKAPLSFVDGQRPNLHSIFNDMKNWCGDNNVLTTGVALCGPKELVSDAVGLCNSSTCKSVRFVTDHEAFEW